MSAKEVDDLISELSRNPLVGDEIRGAGGCKSCGKGKGKSGGYRVITFYTGEALPVFLITAFAKGERVNLTAAECKRAPRYDEDIGGRLQTHGEQRMVR